MKRLSTFICSSAKGQRRHKDNNKKTLSHPLNNLSINQLVYKDFREKQILQMFHNTNFPEPVQCFVQTTFQNLKHYQLQAIEKLDLFAKLKPGHLRSRKHLL